MLAQARARLWGASGAASSGTVLELNMNFYK